jgi:SAM-dependent methyltransferase
MRTCEVCQKSVGKFLFRKEEHSFYRCADCGLIRIEPQPTDAVLERIYGAHYYDAWGLQTDKTDVERIKAKTFEFNLGDLGGPGEGAPLLDCGAATGFLMGVAERMGYTPYGVELSEFGANAIAERFGRDRAHQGQLADANFGGKRFAVITMYDFIEHVREPEVVLKQAFDLLAPGGAISITTPDTSALTHRAMGSYWSHFKLEHLYYFNRTNLRQLLERVGFRDVSTRAAVKGMNLRYFNRVMQSYPLPVVSKLLNAATRLAPRRLQYGIARFPMGEMLMSARRA